MKYKNVVSIFVLTGALGKIRPVALYYPTLLTYNSDCLDMKITQLLLLRFLYYQSLLKCCYQPIRPENHTLYLSSFLFK